MFTNRECNWVSIIIVILFLIFIVCISLWAGSKSKTTNCCKSQTDFKNCKAYFKNGVDMNSDTNYKKICNIN
jgi:hypothetical protein